MGNSPNLWRFLGFGSSIVGFSCFALGSSFQRLLGQWNLLKIVLYCTLSFMFSVFMLFVKPIFQRFPRVFWWKTRVGFLVLLLTSLYSYYDDSKQGKTKEKIYLRILSLISFGAFALMSTSLSRQIQLGFEVGMSNFFQGCLLVGLIKINFKIAMGMAVLCYVGLIIRSYSDSKLQLHDDSQHLTIEISALEMRNEDQETDSGIDTEDILRQVTLAIPSPLSIHPSQSTLTRRLDSFTTSEPYVNNANENDNSIDTADNLNEETFAISSPLSIHPSQSTLAHRGDKKSMRELDVAAIKLQKVYKSYRTRRNLADCAVVAEELWWNALDSATLKQSSISFSDSNKSETDVSKWAIARTAAVKVRKGLSKDNKALELALDHWLEAIDPRHRYGHNLRIYYDVWFEGESTEPFFYWLDVGDGKEIDVMKCPRTTLQRQCIKYLGPKEREEYEVLIENGKLVYRKDGRLVDTDDKSKWIFVLSTRRSLYVGRKQKGSFHHSSFLAGGATTAAGKLVAHEGVLKAIWPYSGSNRSTRENLKVFIDFLEDHDIDISNVMHLREM